MLVDGATADTPYRTSPSQGTTRAQLGAMQPPLEQPIDYAYIHDEVMDRRRWGWPALHYLTLVMLAGLAIWMVVR
jgi:hypothetical protein